MVCPQGNSPQLVVFTPAHTSFYHHSLEGNLVVRRATKSLVGESWCGACYCADVARVGAVKVLQNVDVLVLPMLRGCCREGAASGSAMSCGCCNVAGRCSGRWLLQSAVWVLQCCREMWLLQCYVAADGGCCNVVRVLQCCRGVQRVVVEMLRECCCKVKVGMCGQLQVCTVALLSAPV